MNKATRKAFLVLFVVCVIVIAIAYYLAIKGLSLSLSFKTVSCQLLATGELCHPSLTGLWKPVKWHHYIVTLFWEQAADESEKENLHPILGVCLMSLWSAIATCWERWRRRGGATWSDGKRLTESELCVCVCMTYVHGEYAACVKLY